MYTYPATGSTWSSYRSFENHAAGFSHAMMAYQRRSEISTAGRQGKIIDRASKK